MSSCVIVDIRGHEASSLQDIQSASITICEDDWLEFGSVSGLLDGSTVFVVDLPGLEDLQLLFRKNASWKLDVGSAKPEPQKKRRL